MKKKMCKDLNDHFQAGVRAKRSENTSNVSSSSYETNDEIRARQKKASKREHYKMEKIQKNKAVKLPALSPNSIKSLGSCVEIVENTNCDDEFNNSDNTQMEIIINTPPSRNKMIIDKILSPSNQSVKRKLDFKDLSLSPDLMASC